MSPLLQIQHYQQQVVDLILKNTNLSLTKRGIANVSLDSLEEVFNKIHELRLVVDNAADSGDGGLGEDKENDWDVMKSIYFTFTVVTTIGMY